MLHSVTALAYNVNDDRTVFGYQELEYGPKPDSMTFSIFTGGYFRGLNQNFATAGSRSANIWRTGVRLGYAFNRYLEMDSHLAYTSTTDFGVDLSVYDYGVNGLLNIIVNDYFSPYVTIGLGGIRFREPNFFDFTRFQFDYAAGLKFFVAKNLFIAPEFGAITSTNPIHTAFVATLNLTYYLTTKKAITDRDGDGIKDNVDKCPDQPENFNGVDDSDGCPEILDRDHDGIPDNVDHCPDEPETVNGIDDADGCPEIMDRDHDGIIDSEDKCPDQPETINGYKDEDGCPENPNDWDDDGVLNGVDQCPRDHDTVNGVKGKNGCPPNPNDRDGDGILDNVDKCPDQPETFNKYKDEDGCPEDPNDWDGDGIINEDDKCPKDPETINGYQDDDGCPDKVPNDSDGDGVPDDKDKCPGQKEIYNLYKDDDGCPDDELDEFSGVIEGIYFESNQNTIKKESYPKLNKAAEVLGRYPILNFVIEGHTDNTGGKEYNVKLSEKRAQSVYEYLRYRGISAERMTTQGFGAAKPITENKTSAGRSKNRRIEFRILNLEQAKKEAEEQKQRAR